jgi:hypothetical protein
VSLTATADVMNMQVLLTSSSFLGGPGTVPTVSSTVHAQLQKFTQLCRNNSAVSLTVQDNLSMSFTVQAQEQYFPRLFRTKSSVSLTMQVSTLSFSSTDLVQHHLQHTIYNISLICTC